MHRLSGRTHKLVKRQKVEAGCCVFFGIAHIVIHVHVLLEQRNNVRENKQNGHYIEYK